MNKQTYVRISIAIVAIILTFAASNEHIEPTYLLFGYIENVFGLIGLFVFFGAVAALIYLGLSHFLFGGDIAENVKDALKVAVVCYILVLLIWGYIYFIFRPA